MRMSFYDSVFAPIRIVGNFIPCNVSGWGRQHPFSPYENFLYGLAYFFIASRVCRMGA